MFLKVIYSLLLLLVMTNTSMAIVQQKTFFTPDPISFPAELRSQNLLPYAGQLLDLTKRGVYCITTNIISDDKDNLITPTLFIAPSSYSVIVTFNDLELYRWGDFNSSISMTNFAANAIVLSNIRKGKNRLKFYFYSDGKSMPLPRFYVGDYPQVAKATAVQTLFNLYFIQGIGIIALFSSLLFLGYSAASKFQEHDILYFSLFAFTIFMGYSHFIMNSPTSNDLLWFKISRVGYALAAFLLFLFTCEYTFLTRGIWVKGVTAFFTLTLITAILLFSGSENQGLLNDRFTLFSMLHILPLLFMGYFILIFKTTRKKKATIIVIICGYSLFLMGAIHDILFVVLEKEPYFWVTPYGYFSIITAIIYSLILRYYRSIKRREEAESLLQDSVEKYRGLVESSSDWIWEIDAQGRFIYSNPQVEGILGYKAENLIGNSPFDLMQPGGSDKVRKLVMGQIASGKYITAMVNVYQHKNGNPVTLEMNGSPVLNQEGKIVSYRIIDRDITERKKLEDIIIQSEKMLTVGGLAAGMAHEINNPLAGVIQSANVLSNRLLDKTMSANLKAAESANTTMEAIYHFMENRDIPKMLNAITDSGLRMASIVENMLSFARKSDSAFSTHNPVELLDKVLELASTDFDLKKKYDFKSILIQKEYEKNLPLIACEGGKIQQVLLNILSNGAFAMSESSNTAKPKFILRLQHEADLNMLRLEIEDNGPGMDKETGKRIFEPFFTTKPVGVGTGLGLSVSYFIVVENHDGTMTVSSKLGKGTNFIVRLPVERKT